MGREEAKRIHRIQRNLDGAPITSQLPNDAYRAGWDQSFSQPDRPTYRCPRCGCEYWNAYGLSVHCESCTQPETP